LQVVLSIQNCLAKNKTPAFLQPTCSPELSPTEFFLSKLEVGIKGHQFESLKGTQDKNTGAANPDVSKIVYGMLQKMQTLLELLY
jgi:hypothetical protein